MFTALLQREIQALSVFAEYPVETTPFFRIVCIVVEPDVEQSVVCELIVEAPGFVFLVSYLWRNDL